MIDSVYVCVGVCVRVCSHADLVFSVFKQTAWSYGDLFFLLYSFLLFMTSAFLGYFYQKKKKKQKKKTQVMSKLITWSSFIC